VSPLGAAQRQSEVNVMAPDRSRVVRISDDARPATWSRALRIAVVSFAVFSKIGGLTHIGEVGLIA